MKKLLIGLALGLCASVSNAQSVLSFDVVFDRVLEASGGFTPNLTPVTAGPFSATIPSVNLTAHVILTAVPSSTQLTGTNTITLNGNFSTQSGYSPPSGWSVHTFTNATFNLLDSTPGNSYFSTDFFSSPTNWPVHLSTAANGLLSDEGPASIYGGTCPVFFNCNSAMSGGSGSGTQAYDLFDAGTPVFASGSPVFAPGFRDTGNHPLISGTVSQTTPSTGIGFENGMDAFALQGVLDTANVAGNGNSQLYPDGFNGQTGKVRIVTFSSTGNTAYVVEGHIVYNAVPVPAAAWLMGSALGLLGLARRRAQAA